jgi:general secretion pathway protein N
MVRASPRLARNPPTLQRPPRSPRGWATLGLVLGSLGAVTVFAPATWLAHAVERATAGQIVLAQARGTVWKGTAQLVFTGGAESRDKAALPGPVHWQLAPRWNGAAATLAADCCTQAPLQMRLALHWGSASLQVADGQSQWPASLLTGLGTPWNTLQPQGRLVLRTEGLAFDWSAGRLALGGKAALDALQMSSRLSTLRPMGSYRLELAGGASPSLQLQTQQGPLLLTGSGQWVGQRLRFSGEASAAEGHEAQLSNLLNIIGRRTGARSHISLG